jgi:hypothetical protein
MLSSDWVWGNRYGTALCKLHSDKCKWKTMTSVDRHDCGGDSSSEQEERNSKLCRLFLPGPWAGTRPGLQCIWSLSYSSEGAGMSPTPSVRCSWQIWICVYRKWSCSLPITSHCIWSICLTGLLWLLGSVPFPAPIGTRIHPWTLVSLTGLCFLKDSPFNKHMETNRALKFSLEILFCALPIWQIELLDQT